MVGQAAEGDIVSVYSADGEYLAAGHYQIGSIAVRILSFCGDPSAPEFWFNAIESAYKVRRSVGLADGSSITNCYRLVHGAGVGLRWASPIGPIRVDVATGLSDDNHPIRLHFFIGSQL